MALKADGQIGPGLGGIRRLRIEVTDGQKAPRPEVFGLGFYRSLKVKLGPRKQPLLVAIDPAQEMVECRAGLNAVGG